MSEQSHHPPMRPVQEQDPVCGMKVDPVKAAARMRRKVPGDAGEIRVCQVGRSSPTSGGKDRATR
jgi:hypothetical protein